LPQMKAYSREQTGVIVCILSLLFPLASGKLYCSLKDPRISCAPAPAAVYELRGAGIEEGYYGFPAEQTARSLLQAAGGFKNGKGLTGPAALPDNGPVTAGARVTFQQGEAQAPGCTTASMGAAGRLNFFLPVSLRTATIEDLMLIPGIGAKTAAALIEYRTAHQRIGAVEELQDIPGLGEKKLQSVAPYITAE
jgi:competence protein ComEA